MTMTLCPKKSAEFIAAHSKNVKINEKAIPKLGDLLAADIKSGKLASSNFSQAEVHPKPTDPWALDWIFVVDTLNFCFWHPDNATGWRVEGYTGYFALCAAINRAIRNKPEFLNPNYYSVITEEELGKVMKSDTEIKIPLLSERVKCLHEVGSVLLEKYEGSFKKLVQQADGSAVKLLSIIVENFKCFRDEAVFNGEKVSLYKRAQILIGDIWACFKNEEIGYFHDIDKITMFADYRVPQVLVYFGIMEYSEELMRKLNDNYLFKNGEEEEVEIRGCSIHAVELIKDYVLKKDSQVQINSILIDHFLWDFRRKNNEDIERKKIPFHKTISIYY